MRTIWKYVISDGKQDVALPEFAVFRHLDSQASEHGLSLWFELDTDYPFQNRTFEIVGTGEEVPEGGHYLGSCQVPLAVPPLVWHVYEVK